MLELCPDCGSYDLTEIKLGETSCKNCGLVIDSDGIETNPYLAESTKNRADLPYLVSAGTKAVDGKIYKNIWLLNTREKNLQQGLAEIRSLTEKLRTPDVVLKEARYLFKQAIMQGLAVGRDKTSLVYASVYTASMMHNYPKTALEMTAFTSMTKKKLLRTHKLLRKELNIQTHVIEPVDLLPRFASRLKLNQETITATYELLYLIKEQHLLSGKRPETIIAGAIYTASKQTGETITQRQIANKTGVIEVTIRKLSKELRLID